MQRKSNRSKPLIPPYQVGDLPVRVRLSKPLVEHLQKISDETRLPREVITLEAIRRGMSFLQSV